MSQRSRNHPTARGRPSSGKPRRAPPVSLLPETPEDMLGLETLLGEQGHRRIAGLDEAGRGPLAGPVFAAAVILPAGERYEGLTDSKLLRPAERERWFERIHRVAVASAVTWVGPAEIDEINILEATRKAMGMAVQALAPAPDFLLVDGISPLDSLIPQWCVKQGDRRSQSIAAASILAKVSRDRALEDLHRKHPQYNFLRNKGYGTREHLDALRQWGATPEHRTTFRGVPGRPKRTPGGKAAKPPWLFGPGTS